VSKVNSFSADGFTALHFASFFGQLEAARYLIEKGADVNAVANNTMKVRPLHSAVAHDHVEISALLLEHGASVNARQEGGFVPIHAAAQNGSIRMTKLLLDNGADLNTKTAEGKTPLAIAAEDGAEAGPKAKRQALRRFLVQRGAA